MRYNPKQTSHEILYTAGITYNLGDSHSGLYRTDEPNPPARLIFVCRTREDKRGRTQIQFYCNFIGTGQPGVSTPIFRSLDAVETHVREDWGI